ncbi:MAG: peptidase U32 family protein [Pseudomonadota bacterium]
MRNRVKNNDPRGRKPAGERPDRTRRPQPTGRPEKLPPKPEILAPAGTLAAWAAALEAGADAVYLGLKNFSARAFASNFTLSDLARVVDLTHERGAKIFVAFNSLVKEEELPAAAKLLDALAKIRPDALIVQDLGLFRLIKNHFPGFETHASTLMAVHNRPGLEVLAGLGFDRAVLARELSLAEVEALTEQSPLGLEIFIHGALCFSISGLCLMSSFLGGKGSLRGACVQPCRRVYSQSKKRGCFFSPTDMDATAALSLIRRLPLAALKIEGRMKGAEYVGRVVRAYRLLLDAPEADLERALDEARELIDYSLGRQRSTGFLLSNRAPDGLAPNQAPASGAFLGRVEETAAGGAHLALRHPLEVGDRIRVQFKKDDERQAFTLKKMTVAGRGDVETAAEGDRTVIQTPFPSSVGDLFFKVDTGRGEKAALASPLVRAVQAGGGREINPSPQLAGILRRLDPGPSASPGLAKSRTRKPEIWYKIARAEEVSALADYKPDRIILPVTTPNVRRMASLKKRLGRVFFQVIWSLPPAFFHPARLARDVAQLKRMGVSTFMISNLGHLPLVRGAADDRRSQGAIFADYRLNCLNSWSEAMLADLGVEGTTICLETDEENFKAMSARPGPTKRLFYLFGRPPLFTSRFTPAGLKDNLPLESPRGERFRVRTDQDIFQVFSERPVFFSNILRSRLLGGLAALVVDLEFDPRPLSAAGEVSEAISRGRTVKNASRFNFTRGLF